MFNEDNSVEAHIRDLLSGGLGWDYLPGSAVPREPQDAFVTPFITDALIRLNPDIAANPDLAEEVLYRLRAITLSVRSSGLVSANEEMAAWLQGERSMPFGENHQHVSFNDHQLKQVECARPFKGHSDSSRLKLSTL